MRIPVPGDGGEGATGRDGLLSYAGEWHALLIGLGAGFASAAAGRYDLAVAVVAVALGGSGAEAAKRKLQGKDVVAETSAEPWYSIAGVGLGVVVAAALAFSGLL